MKRKIGMTSLVGLIVVVFMAVFAIPAMAEDGTPDPPDDMAEIRPPHPCTLYDIRISNLAYANEEETEAIQDRSYANDAYKEEDPRWEEFMDDFMENSPLYDLINWSEFDDSGPHDYGRSYHVDAGDFMIEQLERIVQLLRDSGNSGMADRIEEEMAELRLRHAELESAWHAWERAIRDVENAQAWVAYLETKLAEAEEACDRTRGSIPSDDARPGDDPEARRARMHNPMGSDASPATNENHYVMPVGDREQGSEPQSGVSRVALPETQTAPEGPPRAHLLYEVPENIGQADDQSNPSITAQVMLTDQTDDSNEGNTSVGYLTMPLAPAAEIETTSEILEAARIFNRLPERLRPNDDRSTPSMRSPSQTVRQAASSGRGHSAVYPQTPPNQGGNQSIPSVTAQTMQVQQPGSANTGNSAVGYTHMPAARNPGQSGSGVTPRVFLKAVPINQPLRVHLGSSVKR